jgi:phosphoglycerate dehydrogenase-like enzyme
MTTSPAIAVLPQQWSPAFPLSQDEAAYRRAEVEQAVIRAGGTLADAEHATGVVWLQMGDPSPLIETLDNNPAIQWVQLPWAGVENFLQGGLFDRDARFTSAKGAFATQVAEHAVMQMMVACHRAGRRWYCVRDCPTTATVWL